MADLLSVHQLAKRYGTGASEVRAVDGVSFEVPAGEVTLIQGPSGSGKTTLLLMLGLLLRPSEGHISLQGRRVERLSGREQARSRLRDIGFVFQHFNLMSALSARQNVMVPLLASGVSGTEAARRADELLAEVGLEKRLHHLPGDLSGGEQQRVAVARALANRPGLVLADEPTANLDSASGQAVMELLTERVRQGGGALVVVSHDTRIERLADRVLRMEDGRLAS